MSPNPSDHERVRSAFVRALDLPGAARPDFVRQTLADRLDLADVVIDMLEGAGEPARDEDAGWDEPLLALETVGDYRILGLVGRGAMAVVLHAEHVGTGREVALKLLPLGTASRSMRERLARESEVLAELRHENIARWRDGGEVMTPEGRRPFVAMDYFHGRSLLEWVRDHAPDAGRRLAVLEQIARAVAHAHAHGIVHRDLKPTNVLVGAGDRVCVLDFGVAKVLSEATTDGDSLTEVGQIVGTLRFMSPEQASGRVDAIGPATDVHALGLLIHEVMSGAPPYPVPTNVAEALPAIIHARRETPKVDDPRLRLALEKICDAALARDPDERLQDAGLLADDLASAREGRPVPRRRGRWRRVARRYRRPARIAAFVALAAVLAVVLVRQWTGPPVVEGVARLADVEDLLLRSSDAMRDADPDPEHLRRLLVELDAAWEGLATRIDREDAPEWRRLVAWRQGELHLWLSRITDDPWSLDGAREAWERAARLDASRRGLDAVDGDARLVDEIHAITPVRMMSHVAFAHAGLARIQQPTTHLEQAIAWQTDALDQLARDRLGPEADWRDLEPAFGDAEQGHLRNAIAATLVQLAEYRGHAGDAEEALNNLRLVEEFAMVQDVASARATVRYRRARAQMAAAALDTTGTFLEQAEYWATRSLEDRPVTERLGGHVESQAALVRVDRLRTRFAPTQDASTRAFHAALARATALRDTLGARMDARGRGLLALEAAGAGIEAMLRGIPEASATARVWLDRAEAALASDPTPIHGARLALFRARYERACLGLCGESVEEHLTRALGHLADAAQTFPRPEFRRLHRAVDAERRAWAGVVDLPSRR